MNLVEAAEQFYRSDSEKVRSSGIKLLADPSLNGAEELLFDALWDPSDVVSEAAADVLIHRHPWLKLLPGPSLPIPPSLEVDESFQSWNVIKKAIESSLAKEDVLKFSDPQFLNRLESFPGMIPAWIEAFEYHGEPEIGSLLERQTNLLGKRSKDRQLLFAPTYACNLDCSYCYAKGWDRHFKGSARHEDLVFLFDWIREQHVSSLVLAGGEPTVYSHFTDLLELAKDSACRVMLTSNGLFSEKVSKFLTPDYLAFFTGHYDQSYLSDSAREKHFIKNARIAVENGLTFNFRYTLTDTSSAEEWCRVLDIAEEITVSTIQYAGAFRNILDNNSSCDFRSSARHSSSSTMLSEFIQECEKRQLGLHLSKPVPLCLFEETELRALMLKSHIRRACGAYLNNCTHNVTVNPDLSIIPCNSLMSKGPKLTDFNSLEEIGDYFSPQIYKLLTFPYLDRCKKCFFYYRGFCQGVCLAEKHHLMTGKVDELL